MPRASPPTERRAAVGRRSAGLKVLDLTWSVAGPHVGASPRRLRRHGRARREPHASRRGPHGGPVPSRHAPSSPSRAADCAPTATPASSASSSTSRTRPRASRLASSCGGRTLSSRASRPARFARMGFGYERIRASTRASSCSRAACRARPVRSPFRASATSPARCSGSPVPRVGRVVPRPDRSAPTRTSCRPASALAALLAALDHRQRTGEGQYLDLSQAECSMHLQATALLDAEVNGRPFALRGNRDAVMAPHGTYPAAGTDTLDRDRLRRRRRLAGARLVARAARPRSAHVERAPRPPRRARRDHRCPHQTRDALGAPGASCRVSASPPTRCRTVPSAWPIPNSLTAPTTCGSRTLSSVPSSSKDRASCSSRTPGQVRSPGPVYGQHDEEVLALLAEQDPAADVTDTIRHATAD